MARAAVVQIPRGRQAAVSRRRVADAQNDLSGGLNISADPSQLAANEVRQAENSRLTTFGGMLKRLGSRYVHAAAIGSGNPVRGGYSWVKDDGTQQLLAVSNGHLYVGTYGVPMTWTLVAAPALASTSVYPSFAAFRDAGAEVVYIADGGKLLKWDGATLARSATTPSVSRIWVYNQRLYGVSGADAILLASGLNDGDDLGYTAGEGVQVPIRTFGESSLTGGGALGASNILLHRAGISRWVGVTQDDIAIQAGTLGLSPDVGTILPASFVTTETEGYFLSDRGFYAVNQAGVRRISTNLDPDVLALFTPATNLCAVHNRYFREVAFYLPNVGFYVFNYQMQAWSGPWNGGYISPVTHSAWMAVDASNTPIVLVGTASGFVKQMDYPNTYKDNVLSAGTGGSAFLQRVQFRRLFFGDPASDKSLRFFYLLAALNGSTNAGIQWVTPTSSGSFTLEQTGGSSFWGASGLLWGAFNYGTSGSQESRVQTSGRGPYVDVSFVDNGTSPPPLVSALRADAFDMGIAHEYA